MDATIDIKKKFLGKTAERMKKYSELMKAAGKYSKGKEENRNV